MSARSSRLFVADQVSACPMAANLQPRKACCLWRVAACAKSPLRTTYIEYTFLPSISTTDSPQSVHQLLATWSARRFFTGALLCKQGYLHQCVSPSLFVYMARSLSLSKLLSPETLYLSCCNLVSAAPTSNAWKHWENQCLALWLHHKRCHVFLAVRSANVGTTTLGEVLRLESS